MPHETLEYDKLKKILKLYTLSSLGGSLVDQLQPKNEKTNIPFGIMLSGDVNTWNFAEWNKR